MMSSTSSSIRTARGDNLAVVSFALALLYPVALILNDVVTIVRYLGSPLPFSAAALTYTILDFLAVPIIVAAIVLGHLALANAWRQRRLARASLFIGYVSLAGLAMITITLAALSSLYSGRP